MCFHYGAKQRFYFLIVRRRMRTDGVRLRNGVNTFTRIRESVFTHMFSLNMFSLNFEQSGFERCRAAQPPQDTG